MNLEQELMAAMRVGGLVGVAIGLLPLGLGLWRKQTRRAVIGFVACAIGGMVGGLIISGAIAVIALAEIFWRRPALPDAADSGKPLG